MSPLQTADLLIINAAELVTCQGFSDTTAKGAGQGDAGIIVDGAVAIIDGRIAAAGSTAQLMDRYTATHQNMIDASSKVVLPAFVDPHTHLVFAGNRASEWEARMQGKEYLDILRAGGGIHSTVVATRAATEEQLLRQAASWAQRCLHLGTCTVEIKSGYGLDRETELKILRVANRLPSVSPINVVTTYLGAHVVPADYSDRREEYLVLVEELAGRIAAESEAEFFDVYCESGAFTLAETRRLITKARELGLGIKLHADQFTATGAVALGVEYAAVSIDHLEHLDEAGLAALQQGSSVAVVMPGVGFHLGSDQYAPARQLIEAGVALALATDFNPGSSFTPSMPMIIALACRALHLTPAEAIMAGTINAAHAVRRGRQTGSLEVGKQADIIICDIPDHRWLGYSFGWNPVEITIAGGKIV